MEHQSEDSTEDQIVIVLATGESAKFKPGDPVRILSRSPVGHYRVPSYLRGKSGWVEAVIEPRGVDNEEEGFGRNAGQKLHYYRIAILMTDIWPGYEGSPTDGLRIEVFETWLEGI
jgi:nitrile hydratase subunit beta